MKIIGNIIWIVFGGLVGALAFLLIGLLLMITIIGIPFGLQLMKLAKVILWPFGKTVATNFDKHPIMNILWLLTGGISSAAAFLFAALIFFITIIGILFAKQHMKLARLSLIPFGAEIS